VHANDHGVQLQIAAPKIGREAKIGESVAVNGCCLTLTSHHGNRLIFDLLEETIAPTNLTELRRRKIVTAATAQTLCAILTSRQLCRR
jgi:riboflavin synthase alpha subunit